MTGEPLTASVAVAPEQPVSNTWPAHYSYILAAYLVVFMVIGRVAVAWTGQAGGTQRQLDALPPPEQP